MSKNDRFLSPRQAAIALGASESSLKRWVDAGDLAIRRTAGGHRRIPATELVQFARREGMTLRGSDIIGRPVKENGGRLTALLTKALLSGEGDVVRRLLVRAYLDRVPIATLVDGSLRIALEELGQLWLHDAEGIAREHQATLLVMQAAHALSELMPAPSRTAPVAVGGAPAGDPYLLPSLFAGLVIREAGWRTVDLGPNTPDKALIAAARHHKAALVWRSFTGDLEPVTATQGLAQLCSELAPSRVAAGGRRLALLSGLDFMTNLTRLTSMTELAAIAQQEE